MHANLHSAAQQPAPRHSLETLLCAALPATTRSPVGRVHSWLHQRRGEFFRRRFSLGIKEPPAPGCLDLARAVLPSHLPARPSSLFGAAALGGRRRARRSCRRVAWVFTEAIFAHLSFHELGGPKDSAVLDAKLGPYCVGRAAASVFVFV